MSYNYTGTIPASKSIMNRALICASYHRGLILEGDSSCDDVTVMKNAIPLLQQNPLPDEFYCGAAGTVLRFLSLRLSRIPGRHVLRGTSRLMNRPQKDLLDVFKRLGVKCEIQGEKMIIESQGWQNLDKPILVERGVSSQFASGLILNAWDLEKDLMLQMTGPQVSEGYLEMTLNLVKSLGMVIGEKKAESNPMYVVPMRTKVKLNQYFVESDLSSAFAVAAFGALNGEVRLKNFPMKSLQPDFEFVHILQKMEIPVSFTPQGELHIEQAKTFKGIDVSLKNCPDLFPVLAVLCAFANSPSSLHSAPQLVHKESDRIAKTSELLSRMGIPHEKKSDGMLVFPRPINVSQIKEFSYDTDHDHRQAFAAALVKSQGIPIQILHPEVVSKSFPEFWQVVGIKP